METASRKAAVKQQKLAAEHASYAQGYRNQALEAKHWRPRTKWSNVAIWHQDCAATFAAEARRLMGLEG